jgi:hypothetical protein
MDTDFCHRTETAPFSFRALRAFRGSFNSFWAEKKTALIRAFVAQSAGSCFLIDEEGGLDTLSHNANAEHPAGPGRGF